jgi:hypothetical protein
MGYKSSLLNSGGLTKLGVLTHKVDLTLLISNLTKVWVASGSSPVKRKIQDRNTWHSKKCERCCSNL